MRVLPAITFLATYCALSVAISVQHVSQKDFDSLLDKSGMVLAAFTSSTFDEADEFRFRDTFSQAADAVKTNFVTIDCDREKALCKDNDVNAYPAVRLLYDRIEGDTKVRKVERYRGRRSTNAIKSFVTKWELPVMTKLDANSLGAFKQIDDIVIVAFMRPDQINLLETFKSITEQYHHKLIFGYSTDVQAADAEGLAMPAIACYRNIDGVNQVINGHFTESDVQSFIESATGPPIIAEFTDRNVDEFMLRDKLSVYVFATDEYSATDLRRELTSIAQKYSQYIKIGIADAVEFAPMARNFGLVGNIYPALVVHASMNDHIFLYKQGKKIMASVVDSMLTSILQSKAANGHVFGQEAPDIEDARKAPVPNGHDEL